MLYDILLKIEYDYPDTAEAGRHMVRIMPADLPGEQRAIAATMTVTPKPQEWIDRVDYSVDPARGERFYEAIRRYWPDLPDGALAPAYAGIRPKIGEDPGGFADFTLHGPETHGVPGLWNLFGMESPGLTSSLAIGEWVRGRALAG